ncbi:flagellar biosynthetic protein FliO [Marinimicrobium alkaliphilum]|uniref:flagellar biosynthetic protein FliO n=1 Tax=Marinimicrobium alkaliphilum TaxID=2202654 RepID=UPI000DB91AAE|nr:flagellar biosynthetic protein FliO [Marinimicrobium alkaliphilum]
MMVRKAIVGVSTLIAGAWAPLLVAEGTRADTVAIGSGTHLLNVTLGLGAIVLLILGLAWLVRRLGQGGLMHNPHMKVLATMPMGTRERLMVVDVAGQQLLLGVTATQITLLHTFDEPVIAPGESAYSSEFGRKLKALLQQKTSSSSDDSQPR